MNEQKQLKIGVFDSGVGGVSVARAIRTGLPGAEVVFVNDAVNVPYGNKPIKQIYGFVLPILKDLARQQCDAIVIACNTVSTNLSVQLRKEIKIPIIALEPMVKPATGQTKSKIIAVCATPATLKSKRYQYLKEEFASGIKVLEPDCSRWSHMIENNQLDREIIKKQVQDMKRSGADVIVLGCTHYHWIEEDIKQFAGSRVRVLQPETAIVRQVKRVLGLPL